MTPLEKYLVYGLPRVDGWLEPYSAEIIGFLSDTQRASSIQGTVGEIGVHHGKLFLVLLLTMAPGERAFAIDIFEQQELNIDGSGQGDRARFVGNIRRWFGDADNMLMIARSSLDVTPQDITRDCELARLVSIDGGHTEQCTLNDLHLAENVLTDKGVAIIDDYFNSQWPDIATGVAKYLLDKTTKLRPFAISPNKIYLTAPIHAPYYRSVLATKYRRLKESVMFGAPVDIYSAGDTNFTVKRLFKEVLRSSFLGPYLLGLKHRYRSRSV